MNEWSTSEDWINPWDIMRSCQMYKGWNVDKVRRLVREVFCWGGDRNIMRLWRWMGGGWSLAARLVNTWIVLFILPQFYAGVLLHGSASPSWKLLWIDIKMQWCKTVNKPQSGRRWVLDLCLGLRMSNIGIVCTSFTIYKFTHQLSLRRRR